MSFYISRKLSSSDITYTEEELLAAYNYVVVLAEPGGGKTELLRSLARKLDASVVTANLFRHVGADVENFPLVIDAFDELVKVDQAGIHKLLANARKANPTRVIISSRSSEWGHSATSAFHDFLGHRPLVVRLCEFEEAEQRDIFNNHLCGEDFSEFREEVSRFDLESLLPNPQFLKLFADAYVESGRSFTDKRSIFSQAIESLAKEVNVSVGRGKSSLSVKQKISYASELFAKILLSGTEGVGTSEATENQMYPLLASLCSSVAVECVLATRLFKPGDQEDQHRPVHKIVAEYCAADYLIKRIIDPKDPLTLEKCLPIIAPNSSVRDELRGLVGWMAALGNRHAEEVLINLDPYAVLANGDPSQLEGASKRLLVMRLKEVEAKDPYFRRGDFWRRFSAAGFFTPDLVEELRVLLSNKGSGHLRSLILELLVGSPAIEKLSDDLRRIMLDSREDENARLLASRCLLELPDYDHPSDYSALIAEGTHASLSIAANATEVLGVEVFGLDLLADYFRACSKLYPGRDEGYGRVIGVRYFVKSLIGVLRLEVVEWLLDCLTCDLMCGCGKESYECDCRNGISKVVGSLLDRYFDLSCPPFDPGRVLGWVRNLNFHESKSAKESRAVEVLQECDALRQGIISLIFGGLVNREEIFEARLNMSGWQSHSGLCFKACDHRFIVDLAFEAGNAVLWGGFIVGHQHYRKKSDPDVDGLRRHMREQASINPSFMREWMRSNKETEQFQRQNRFHSLRRSRKVRRSQKRQSDIYAANMKYVQENRDLVESGRHWGCLVRFAELVLMRPEGIEREFGDEGLVRSALRNCIDFITPNIPDLHKLAELQCASKYQQSELILYASCLEILRKYGDLDAVDVHILKSLRTGIDVHYSAVSQEDKEALKAEVDRRLFDDADSAELFLRQYVEPQLSQVGCVSPDVWLLHRDDAFGHLRAAISVEWLARFQGLAIDSLDTVFEVAAQYGDRRDLNFIIEERCAELRSDLLGAEDIDGLKQRRDFWFLRAFYFLNEPPEFYKQWFDSDKDAVLLFSRRSGRITRSDYPYWPRLTSGKIEVILDAFVEEWPRVDLPNHWGTESSKEESAYRFLSELIWLIDSDDPDEAIPVLLRLISNSRFMDFHKDLKSVYSSQLRRFGLRDFEPPSPQDIVDRLDHDLVVTVEGLRQILIQELHEFQRAITGGEYNSVDRFYEKGERLGEVRSTEIIAERLSLRLESQGISVTPEHQLKDANRSDFTVTKMISGKRKLLVVEVKGQWHRELYTAASAQLYERYSIHPDAEQQGVFLVIWFGANEEVAGSMRHGIRSAQELKRSIEDKLPKDLEGLIDVFVLDVSRN